MPTPARIERAAVAIGDVYRLAEEAINAELASIIDDANQSNRIRRLRALSGEVDRRSGDLEGEAKAFLNHSMPDAWKAGASNVGLGQFQWTQAHRQALGLLAQDQFKGVLKSTRFMSRDVKSLIREEGARSARLKVATGATARQAGSQLEARLKDRGISAVTYRDGRNIRASTYTEMLMRTSTALAYNLGALNQMKSAGIQYVEMIDGADCGLVAHDDTFKVNGKVVTLETAAQYPISHPNAVMDGSVVEPVGRLLAVFRACWSGPVVRVRTSRGSRLTVGPNHPVLTRSGWVKAQVLRVGDHVVSGTIERSPAPTVGHVDLEQVPSRVEDLFAAARQSGTHTRVVAASDHFHGDGNYCKGDIDVVDLHPMLSGERHAASSQRLAHGPFVMATGPLAATGLRPGLTDFNRVDGPSPSGVGRSDVGRVGGPVADLDSRLAEAHANGGVRAPVELAELLGRCPGAVTVDQIVEIEFDTWTGHGFDLETETGTYWCDGTLVHNCRRDFAARPDVTAEEADSARSLRPDDQLSDQANFEKYLLEQSERRARSRSSRQPRTSGGGRTTRTARAPRQPSTSPPRPTPAPPALPVTVPEWKPAKTTALVERQLEEAIGHVDRIHGVENRFGAGTFRADLSRFDVDMANVLGKEIRDFVAETPGVRRVFNGVLGSEKSSGHESSIATADPSDGIIRLGGMDRGIQSNRVTAELMKKQEWWTSPATEGVVSHELGHMVDYAASGLGFAKRDGVVSEALTTHAGLDSGELDRLSSRILKTTPEIKAKVSPVLSTYAATNYDEVIAESFAEVRHYGDKARPLASAVVDGFRRIVKGHESA